MAIRATEWSGDVRTVLAEATNEAQTALGLDERDPWAHLTCGVVLVRMRRRGEAERALRRALELNPNFALAHAVLGHSLALVGGHQEALGSAKQALRLSPIDPLVFTYAARAIAGAHFAAGNYPDGVVWARRAIESRPEIVFPQGGYRGRGGRAGHPSPAPAGVLAGVGQREHRVRRRDARARSRRLAPGGGAGGMTETRRPAATSAARAAES